MERKFPDRVEDLTCLFAEFGQLAAKYKAVDLAIGTPEQDPPQFLKDQLIEAVHTGPHQYHHPRGYPPLRESLAKHYSEYYKVLERDLDPKTEILATAGGVAGLYCS